MKCNDREKLFLFVHRMLDHGETEQVRQHVAGCAECRRVVGEYGKLGTVLDDWNAGEPSPWFDARLRARVAENAQKEPGFFGFGRARALVATVASVILILGVLVVFHHQMVENHQPAIVQQQQPEAAVTAPQTPATTEAQRQPLPAAEQLKMDENLSLLEDYDVVSNFDALSELPQANDN